ncbi:MAG: hypothetical protein Q8P18_19720 [Pseudomonadota bacterium]|nr:hypothetical protein [Pseudomonadota bacterium]
MISAFLSALFGRCPCCGRGSLYQSFLKFNETCAVCHVRFERWSGSWTIPTVMGYGSGAVFAIVLGYVFHRMGRLEGSENIIIPATIGFTVLLYPVCKNLSMFMLFQNGFIFVDPPTLVREGASAGGGEPRPMPSPPSKAPEISEDRLVDPDEPTDGGGHVA